MRKVFDASLFASTLALAHTFPARAAEPTDVPASAPATATTPPAVASTATVPATVPATVTAVAPSAEPAPTSTNTAPAPVAGSQPETPPTNAGTAKPTDADANTAPSWVKHLTVGGGATLWHYHSLDSDTTNFSLFNARLTLDGKWGAFGLHLEPRFRDTKLRPFFDGPVWVQEVYASANFAPVVVKVGKVYKQSGGLFWDNSFYGNVQVYDGLKLDPNYGISVEGGVGKEAGVDFAAQYFVVDGSTNVSLQGRDTISVTDANGARSRRKNTLAARVSPFYRFGEGSEIRLGLSAERFQAALPNGEHKVARLAADLKLTYALGEAGNLGIWGEYLHQGGRHVVDHPLVGGASKNTHYVLVGGEYNFWKFTARYNFSYADYRTVKVTEVMHVPAVRYAIDDHLGILGELVVWRQHTPTADIKYDTSTNITLNGQF